MRAWRRTTRIAFSMPVWCAAVLALQISGCGPSTQPSAEQRQDKALKDPFGYSPDLKNSDMTVSGHSEFDRQELKRDVDHVINP